MTLPTWIKEIEERAESVQKSEWFGDIESIKCLSICVSDVPKLIAALKIAVEGLSFIKDHSLYKLDEIAVEQTLKAIEDLK